MEFPKNLKEETKVVGYLAQTNTGQFFSFEYGKILVVDTKKKMAKYLSGAKGSEKFNITIKKIKFSDIAKKMNNGSSFLFDKGAFGEFARIAKINNIKDVPSPDFTENVEDSKEKGDVFVACLATPDQGANAQLH